jgi:hypothetical protein
MRCAKNAAITVPATASANGRTGSQSGRSTTIWGKPSVTSAPKITTVEREDRLDKIVVQIPRKSHARHCTRQAPVDTPSSTARYISVRVGSWARRSASPSAAPRRAKSVGSTASPDFPIGEPVRGGGSRAWAHAYLVCFLGPAGAHQNSRTPQRAYFNLFATNIPIENIQSIDNATM